MKSMRERIFSIIIDLLLDFTWIDADDDVCAGFKALLRYEGFDSDSTRDFWLNLCVPDIHPVGWCAAGGKPLVPPQSEITSALLELHMKHCTERDSLLGRENKHTCEQSSSLDLQQPLKHRDVFSVVNRQTLHHIS